MLLPQGSGVIPISSIVQTQDSLKEKVSRLAAFIQSELWVVVFSVISKAVTSTSKVIKGARL